MQTTTAVYGHLMPGAIRATAAVMDAALALALPEVVDADTDALPALPPSP